LLIFFFRQQRAAVVEVVEEAAEPKTIIRIAPILNPHIHNHNNLKHQYKLHQRLELKTLTQHVSFSSVKLAGFH
jgi:hypothetical protein